MFGFITNYPDKSKNKRIKNILITKIIEGESEWITLGKALVI